MIVVLGRRWKGVRLTIPPYIPESRLDGCDIIDIKYELIFKADISGGNEIKIVIPIVVGTMQGHEGSGGATRAIAGVPNGESYIRAPENTPEGIYEEPMSKEPEINGNHRGDNLNDEEKQSFRRPMNPGDTRRNPLFDQN